LIGVLRITIPSQFTTFITYKENTSTVFSKYIDVLKVTLSQRLMYPKSILSVKEGSKSGLPLKIFILLETLGVGSKKRPLGLDRRVT
jgi:hypothetical protein